MSRSRMNSFETHLAQDEIYTSLLLWFPLWSRKHAGKRKEAKDPGGRDRRTTREKLPRWEETVKGEEEQSSSWQVSGVTKHHLSIECHLSPHTHTRTHACTHTHTHRYLPNLSSSQFKKFIETLQSSWMTSLNVGCGCKNNNPELHFLSPRVSVQM